MIHLYTRAFFWSEKIKRAAKRALGVKEGGPQAVEDSLVRGLSVLTVPFALNRPLSQAVDVLCVPTGGVKALRWAVAQKRKGLAKKILAGPILVVTPPEDNWLILNPEVDAYLVPSEWVRNWWDSFHPGLKDKIILWPAGTKDMGPLVKPDGKILVYQKNAPEALFKAVLAELDERKLPYEILRYGSYSNLEYVKALSSCRLMVYLSQSESQGIALQEAWMAGVPTLVWNRGYMSYKTYRWEDPKISAPFLTDECGKFFRGSQDFTGILDDFLNEYNLFTPRAYSLEHFTDAVSAQKYIGIIKTL
jgi:hypothetical protein